VKGNAAFVKRLLDAHSQSRECRQYFIESYCWYGDLETVVVSGGIAVHNSSAQPAATYVPSPGAGIDHCSSNSGITCDIPVFRTVWV
jgi:hypothetical protein